MPEQSDGKRARDRQFFRREDSADDQKPLSSSAVYKYTQVQVIRARQRVWIRTGCGSLARSLRSGVSHTTFHAFLIRLHMIEAPLRDTARIDGKIGERERGEYKYIYIYIYQRKRERMQRRRLKEERRLERRRGYENRALPTPTVRPRAFKRFVSLRR